MQKYKITPIGTKDRAPAIGTVISIMWAFGAYSKYVLTFEGTLDDGVTVLLEGKPIMKIEEINDRTDFAGVAA